MSWPPAVLCASGNTFLVEHDSLNLPTDSGRVNHGKHEHLAPSTLCLSIVGDARPVHCRSEGDADVGAGIVVLTLIENGNVLHPGNQTGSLHRFGMSPQVLQSVTPLPVHLWEICSCSFRRHDVRVWRDIPEGQPHFCTCRSTCGPM